MEANKELPYSSLVLMLLKLEGIEERWGKSERQSRISSLCSISCDLISLPVNVNANGAVGRNVKTYIGNS